MSEIIDGRSFTIICSDFETEIQADNRKKGLVLRRRYSRNFVARGLVARAVYFHRHPIELFSAFTRVGIGCPRYRAAPSSFGGLRFA